MSQDNSQFQHQHKLHQQAYEHGASDVQLSLGQRQLAYWKSLESLQAPGIPHGVIFQKASARFRVFAIDRFERGAYPWDRASQEDEARLFAVHLGCFASNDCYAKLSVVGQSACSQKDGKSHLLSLGSLKVCEKGSFLRNSFVLSEAMWVLGCLQRGLPVWDGYEQEREHLRALADNYLSVPLVELGDQIEAFTDFVIEALGLSDVLSGLRLRHRAWTLAAGREGDEAQRCDGMLVPQRDALAKIELLEAQRSLSLGGGSKALRDYLGENRPDIRLSIESDEGKDACALALLPAMGGLAKWSIQHSASPKKLLPMTKSEVLAANLVRKELTDNGGLQAITNTQANRGYQVIQDLVTDALVSKADALASFPRSGLALSGDAYCGKTINLLNPHLHLDNHGVVISIPTLAQAERMRKELSRKVGTQLSADDDEALYKLHRLGVVAADISTHEGLRALFSDVIGAEGGVINILKTSLANPLSNSERQALWASACDEYRQSKGLVLDVLERTGCLEVLIRRATRLKARLKAIEQSSMVFQRIIGSCDEVAVARGQAQEQEWRAERDRLVIDVQATQSDRFAFLSRYNKSKRGVKPTQSQSHERMDELERLLSGVRRAREQATLQNDEALKALSQLANESAVVRSELDEITVALHSQPGMTPSAHVMDWLNGDIHSLSSEADDPWRIEGLDDLRHRVFRSAFMLQAVFIRLESARLLQNLEFALSMLKGRYDLNKVEFSPYQIKTIWATLGMFVPVMLCLGSAAPRALRTIGEEGISLVVMGDAGLVKPGRVLGLLSRAKKAVFIGNPHSCSLGTNVPKGVRRSLMRQAGLNRDVPASESAQSVAQGVSVYGMPLGVSERTWWSGLPLRTCNVVTPLIPSLLSDVAGFGLSTNGVNHVAGDDFESGWLDVRPKGAGTWLKFERVALVRLLETLFERGVKTKQISIVVPDSDAYPVLCRTFRNRHRGLSIRHSANPQVRSWDYVILMLGGVNPASIEMSIGSGALVMGSAGMAKSGFFVIGDRGLWMRTPLMKAVSKKLTGLSLDIVQSVPRLEVSEPDSVLGFEGQAPRRAG